MVEERVASRMEKLPIIDLHCDLLIHLLMNPDADPNQRTFGASFPCLKEGNVGLQVMAIYTPVDPRSSELGVTQSEIHKKLLRSHDRDIFQAESGFRCGQDDRIGVVAAIESATGICNEEESLENAFKNLETILENCGRLFYISLTHHEENRFGGGNYSKPGLKADGEVLLDYLSGKQIAVDLSHTSDALAHDILDYTYKKGLKVPVIASHSNFREIWDHPRNLTEENAEEVIRRGGLIGMNFLRAFVNNDQPEALLDHINYGLSLGGGENALCFGADFFNINDFPDPSRHPYYFPDHEDATKYHQILQDLGDSLSVAQKSKLAYQNVERFIAKNWN